LALIGENVAVGIWKFTHIAKYQDAANLQSRYIIGAINASVMSAPWIYVAFAYTTTIRFIVGNRRKAMMGKVN
jgi:hypothetical protein